MNAPTEASRALTFGQALHAIKKGAAVRRQGWKGSGLWLSLQQHSVAGKLPIIYLNYPTHAPNAPDARMPWQNKQEDLVAEDWTVLNQ